MIPARQRILGRAHAAKLLRHTAEWATLAKNHAHLSHLLGTGEGLEPEAIAAGVIDRLEGHEAGSEAAFVVEALRVHYAYRAELGMAIIQGGSVESAADTIPVITSLLLTRYGQITDSMCPGIANLDQARKQIPPPWAGDAVQDISARTVVLSAQHEVLGRALDNADRCLDSLAHNNKAAGMTYALAAAKELSSGPDIGDVLFDDHYVRDYLAFAISQSPEAVAQLENHGSEAFYAISLSPEFSTPSRSIADA